LLRKVEWSYSHDSTGFDASLFASVGITLRKQLPIAHYRYLTHQNSLQVSESVRSVFDHSISVDKNSLKKGGGGYTNKTHTKMILCADPVHFEVGLNDITLTQQIDDLTEEEAIQCIEALNQHFKQDGLEFIYGSQSQWYLVLRSKTKLDTTPLLEVLRKNIAHYFPVSKNMNWEVIQNEVQMILHMLPLNQKREIAGLPTLNSLWFYGGGEPENFANTLNAVFSDNEEKGGLLAVAAGCDYSPLPKYISSLFDMASGKYIVILDQLLMPAIYDDVQEYQKQLISLDDYIEPIIKAWENDKIELVIDSCTGRLLKPIKIPRWQFWARHSFSLTDIAQ